jgi:hypothetical protein
MPAKEAESESATAENAVINTELLPLYIGITGHRDIRDEDKLRLKQMIKDMIMEKTAQCPDTPVVILTPLAEGADRLAAHAALECGVSFIAPLPMPVDEYRKDFITRESLDEFNELLDKAEQWFEMPLPEGTRAEELQNNIEKRNDQYYDIGYYIARQSQILIALWDGIDNKKRGGTAHIVNLKRTGLPTAHPHIRQRLKNLQTGPIYHILTPRKGIPLPMDAFDARMIYTDHRDPDSSGSMELDRQLLGHIDSFNRDVKMLAPKLKEKIERSETALFVEGELIKENPELRKIARCHAITDTLASHFQTRRFFALKVLLVLAVVAFMFFQIYVEFWHKPAVLLLYPITMGIGALWFLRASRKRFEQKHEDYRALSEAFRVQYFLILAERKARVSEYYLQKHKGELEWVIYALRASLLKFPAPNNQNTSRPDENNLNKYKYIHDHWVADQLAYYKKTSRNYHLHLESLRRMANRFFFGALGAAIILFVLSAFVNYLPSSLEYHAELLHSVLVVCTHSFLVISAAILGYNEKMIFAEQSKTFHQMVQLFDIASEKLTKAIESDNLEEAREIIWELALESLMENADWLLLHRSRPMEMPKG